MIVGNKSDLESQRAVTVEEAKEIANRYNLEYVETSAKSGTAIEKAFQ